MRDYNAWNKEVIEEFRANGGWAGGHLEGMPLLILFNHGAKTGALRINPLAYQKVEGGYAIFGSKGGSPTHPAWYHNLMAKPDVEIELGTETFAVRARADGRGGTGAHLDPAEARLPAVRRLRSEDLPPDPGFGSRTHLKSPVSAWSCERSCGGEVDPVPPPFHTGTSHTPRPSAQASPGRVEGSINLIREPCPTLAGAVRPMERWWRGWVPELGSGFFATFLFGSSVLPIVPGWSKHLYASLYRNSISP